jgi:hypothetical protein
VKLLGQVGESDDTADHVRKLIECRGTSARDPRVYISHYMC